MQLRHPARDELRHRCTRVHVLHFCISRAHRVRAIDPQRQAASLDITRRNALVKANQSTRGTLQAARPHLGCLRRGHHSLASNRKRGTRSTRSGRVTRESTGASPGLVSCPTTVGLRAAQGRATRPPQTGQLRQEDTARRRPALCAVLLVCYRYVQAFGLAKVRPASKCTQHTAMTSVQTRPSCRGSA